MSLEEWKPEIPDLRVDIAFSSDMSDERTQSAKG